LSLYTQYLTVLAMSVSGAVLGAVYDVYRTILAEWRYLRWMSSILDFAYWIFALGLVLWALEWANDGDVRFYVFVIMAIGLALYRLLLRKLVVGSTVRMVLAITFLVKTMYRLFLMLVVTPLLWLWSLLLALLRLVDRMAAIFERIILWPFRPLLRALEWIMRKLYQLAIEPLIEPVMKPFRKHVLFPVRKFFHDVKEKWKGFLRRVANWLVDADEDDPDKPKR
jgi:spore cortex biosynthesis protein YabQ